MIPSTAKQSLAWAFLVGATLLSIWTSGHMGIKAIAVAISIAIAAAKVIVVLHCFMDMGRVTLPFRIFFYVWTTGCAAMIGGIAWLSV
jgi:hypothetical protein